MRRTLKRSVLILVGAALTATLLAAPAGADPVRSPQLFAVGLDNPRGLAFAPDGRLLVAEAGRGGSFSTVGVCPHTPPPIGPFTGGPTARISALDSAGTRTTVSDGLPSAQTAPESGSEVLGAEEVAFLNGATYVLTQGGGCSKGNPDQPNGIYRLEPDGSRTLIANLSAWIAANPTAGPPDNDHDPEGVPTSIVAGEDRFYVLEGNNAQLVEVRLNGTIRRIVDFSLAVGHRTYTALERGRDGNFYVGTFSEIPYTDGSSSLFRVTPKGDVTEIATGLTTVIDIRFDCAGRLHVLESSTGNTPAPPFLVPGSGRILRRVDGRFQLVAAGLTFPTGMAFGPDRRLYVSHRGYGVGPQGGLGEVVAIETGGPTCAQ